MKYSISGIIIGLVSLLSSVSAGEWIRINQLGYLPESPKVAVFMSEGKAAVEGICTCRGVYRGDCEAV